MTLDQCIAALQRARELIFSVEQEYAGRGTTSATVVLQRGLNARAQVGNMEHELLIEKGVRNR